MNVAVIQFRNRFYFQSNRTALEKVFGCARKQRLVVDYVRKTTTFIELRVLQLAKRDFMCSDRLTNADCIIHLLSKQVSN